MKNLLLIMLMVSLNACRSGDLYHSTEQCAPTFVYSDDSQKYIDSEKSFCSTRLYEFDINHVGPIPGSEAKKAISYCDRCVGFKNYADTASFWEIVRRRIEAYE